MRPKLTYANVMATLAVFPVLGGGAAFAATHLAKSSIGTKQLKKNAVTGEKVKNHSLTGRDIVVSTLGTVPSSKHAGRADTAGDSSTLQGNGPDAFIHGDGAVVGGRRDLDPSTEAPLIDIPGMLHLTAQCTAGPKVTVLYANISGQPIDGSHFFVGSPASAFEIGTGTTGKTIVTAPAVEELQFATRTTPPETASLRLMLNVNSPKPCMASAEATLARGQG